MLVECCPYLDSAIPRPVVHPPPRLPPPPPPETHPTSPDIVVIDEESSASTTLQAHVSKEEPTSADAGAATSASTEPAVVGAVGVTKINGEAGGGGTGGGGGRGSVRPDRIRGGCCEPSPTSARHPPSAQIECSGERGAVKVLARKTKQDERCFQRSGLAVTAEVETAAAAATVSPLRKKSKRDEDVAIGRVPFAKALNVQ